MNIDNPLLVSEVKKYPFDQISREYDTFMLVLKVVISIEHNLFEHHKFICKETNSSQCYSVDLLTLFFNILMYIIIFIAFIRFDVLLSWVQFHYSSLYGNTDQNTLRKYLIGFNFLITTFVAIGYNIEDTYAKSVLLFSCALIIVLLFFCLNHSLNSFPSGNNSNYVLTYGLVLYMLINNMKTSKRAEIKHIQDTIFLDHIKKCNEKQCQICSEYSENIDTNIGIFSNHLKFIHENTKNFNLTEKEEDYRYKDFIDLFSYQLKKNIFSFFLLYYSILNKARNDSNYSNNLKLIVNNWLNKGDISQTKFFSMIFELSILENQLNIVLDDFVNLANERVETYQHKIAFTLAMKLKNLIENLKNFWTENEYKEDITLNDIIVKLTHSVIKYNMTILRYIVESLLNQEMINLPSLNIDLLDDYLNMHYANDNLLIMSIDFHSISKEIKLLKVTGELSYGNPKILSDYFPKKVKTRLLEIFRNKIQAPHKNLMMNYNLDYVLILLKFKKVINMYKYSYRLSEELKNESLIIYGYYAKEAKKCIILDFINKKNEIVIVDACKELFMLTKIKSSWMYYVTSTNMNLCLSTLFQSFKLIDNNSIECYLDYNYLQKSFKKLSNRLLKIDEFKKKPKNIDDLNVITHELQKLTDRSLFVYLEKIEDITEQHYSIYHLNLQKILISPLIGDTKINQVQLETQNVFGYNQNFSNTSMTQDYSCVSRTISKKTKESEYQMINLNLKKKIEKETKHLSMFSLIMIFLNITLIIICSIFLITQINQTRALSQANDFLFQFKMLRILVANFVVSISSTICIAEDPTKTECINCYQTFSDQFNKDYGNKNGLSFVDYLLIEVKYKAVYTQEVLSSVQQEFYSSGNQKYINIFTTNMSYFIYDYTSGKIELTSTSIPFHEGLRKYINSIYIICNSRDQAKHEPLYFLTYTNGTYSFSNVLATSLTVLQEEIYSILINYFNFSISFNKGERVLQLALINLKNTNVILNSLFMICIALLNLILLVLCIGNLNTAYSLFKVLIFNVINQMDDIEFSKYFKNKITLLKQLSKLYYKNPNDLINKNKDDRFKYSSFQTDNKYANITFKKSNHDIKENLNHQVNRLKLHFGSQFYYSVVFIHFCVLFIVFTLYFSIIIAFDLKINDTFTELFDIFEYVYLQYSHENSIFVNLSLAHLVAILNITEADLASVLNKTNTDDGLINYLVRESFANYYTLLKYKEKKNSKKFPSLADHVNYTCDHVFDSINDIYMSQVKAEHNDNYSYLPIIICSAYDSLNLEGFSFLLLNLEQRTQELGNIKLGNDYKSLYYFSKSSLLYEAYSLALILYRPICTHFRNQFLQPTLKQSFSDYILFVVAYLCVNIFIEILIFVIIKWFILLRLETIQSNLYLLNNCVN